MSASTRSANWRQSKLVVRVGRAGRTVLLSPVGETHGRVAYAGNVCACDALDALPPDVGEVGSAQIGVIEYCSAEVCAGKTRAIQIGIAQIGLGEGCMIELRT